MRTPLFAGLAVVAVTLAACDQIPGFKAPAANTTNATAPAAPIVVATPAPINATPVNTAMATPAPSELQGHRWSTHENGEYGYTAATPDGRAQPVVMLRYAGFSNGYDTLISHATGYMAAQCARPCQTIWVTEAGGVRRQVTLDPASIIGEAFADAASGQLDVYVESAKPAPTPRAYVAPHTYVAPRPYVAPQAPVPTYVPPSQERPFYPRRPWQQRRHPYLNREGGYVDPNAAG